MADRIHFEKKSKPFTTISIYKLIPFSVCGDKKFQEAYNIHFKKLGYKRKEQNKSNLFWKYLKKDIGQADFDDLLNSRLFKEFDESMFKAILVLLEKNKKIFPNKQEYFRSIIEREIAKKEK